MEDQLELLSETGILDFSLSSLAAGLIFGVIGWYIYRDGRRGADLRFVFIGIALMIYPYFTKGPWLDWGVGLVLCGVAYGLKKQ